MDRARASVIFGSVAAGCADRLSDVDVLVICKPRLPARKARRRLYDGLNGVSDIRMAAKDPAWQPVFRETDTFRIGSALVDVAYETAARLTRVISQVAGKGALTTKEVPFRPWHLAAVVGDESIVVGDPDGIIEGIRSRLYPLPEAFKRNLVQEFLPALESVASDMRDLSERGIGPAAYIFLLWRAVDYFTAIIAVLNDRYPSATKRVEQYLAKMDKGPRDFSMRLSHLTRGPFDPRNTRDISRHFGALTSELREMPEIGALCQS